MGWRAGGRRGSFRGDSGGQVGGRDAVEVHFERTAQGRAGGRGPFE